MASVMPRGLGGRHSAFRAEFVEQARKLARLDASNAQLADFFGIDELILARWRERYPEFSQALEEGRTQGHTPALRGDRADKILATALARERRTAGRSGPFALDPTACILWLKSRPPDRSANAARNLPRNNDGKPLEPENKGDKLSDLELARRVAFILAGADPAIQNTWAPGSTGTASVSASTTEGI